MDPISLSAGAQALALLKRFWYVVPLLAITIYVGVLKWDNASLRKQVASLIGEKAQLEQRNAVTYGSLQAAIVNIDELNAAAEERAKKLQADAAEARASEARMAERYRSTASKVDALNRAARDATRPECEVSPEALEALKEL